MTTTNASPVGDTMTTTHLELSAMLVHLNVRRWTARKTDHSASDNLTDSAAAKHGVARVTKDLIPRTHIRAINAVYDSALQSLRDMSLPWSDDGRRLMPVNSVIKFQGVMDTHKNKFWAAVGNLQLAYKEEMDAARIELGSLFNERDYPPLSEIEGKFSFAWCVEPVPTSSDIRVQMPDSLRDNIAHQMDKHMEERLEAATKATFKRVYDQLSKMNRVLSAETPRIYDSLMEGVETLIEVLPDLNLTNDPALAEMASKLHMSFGGMTSDTLRGDSKAREEAKSKSGALLLEVGGLL